MNETIIQQLTTEIGNAFSPEKAVEIGILTVKTANQTVTDASTRPDPTQLYLELWYEGEVMLPLRRLQPRKINLRSPNGRRNSPHQKRPLRRLRALRQTIPAPLLQSRHRRTPHLPRRALQSRNQSIRNRRRRLRRTYHQRHRSRRTKTTMPNHHNRQPHIPLQRLRQKRRY